MQPPSPPSLRDHLTEKFHALLDECDLIPSNPHTLDTMETFFLDKGRKFLQETFQEKLQERIEQTEATTESPCADCKKKRPSKTRNRKQSSVLTESLKLIAATTIALCNKGTSKNALPFR